MSEPLTSNPLVERLRAEYSRTGAYAPTATCRHGIHPYDCRQGCAPPTFEAADEIERLTAEAGKNDIEWQNYTTELEAERDRLAAELAQERTAATNMQTVAAGYKAELDAWKAKYFEILHGMAGRLPDETSAAQETVEVRRGAWVFVRTAWDTGHAIVKVSGTNYLVTQGGEGGIGTAENG